MKKILVMIITLSMSLVLNAHATSIDIITDKNQINIGDSVTLQVRINGLNDFTAPSLGDYDVNLNYNPNIFSVSAITWGDEIVGDQLDLSGFGSLKDQSTINAGTLNTGTLNTGTLNFFELSFDNPLDLNSLQAGSFTLFSVLLSSIAQGTGDFSLDINAIGDAFGNSIDVVTIDPARVNVAQLPEPSSLILALSGLIFILWRKRKI